MNEAQAREIRLIIKSVNRDVRKMLREWHDSRSVGIDTIIESCGYTQVPGSLYKFREMVVYPFGKYEVTLDTFGLVHENSGSIEVSVILK